MLRKYLFVLAAALWGGCAEGPTGPPKPDPTPTPAPATCVYVAPTTSPGLTVQIVPKKDDYGRSESVTLCVSQRGADDRNLGLFWAQTSGAQVGTIWLRSFSVTGPVTAVSMKMDDPAPPDDWFFEGARFFFLVAGPKQEDWAWRSGSDQFALK